MMSGVYTIEDYFALEARSAVKLEYYSGNIVEMAGADPIHNQISARIIHELITQLDPKEQTYHILTSDTKIQIPAYNCFVYPDALVICEAIERYEGNPTAITNPLLVVEVISPSTEAYDRGDKFLLYRSVPSFKEYVMLRQDKPYGSSFYRKEASLWEEREASGLDATLYLPSLDITLNLARVYKGVSF